MATYTPPFKGNNMPELLRTVVNDDPADISDFYSDDLNNLIKTLLDKKP